MNEFIVWDSFSHDGSIRLVGYERINKDGNWEYKRENRNVFHLGTISDNQGNVTFKRFPYIGKTDTEGNKIYADSSIFEFEYLFNDDSNNLGIRENYIGYFSYNNDKLRYEIKALQVDEGKLIKNDIGMWVVSYDYRVLNLKAIGTLQEDKHLLGEQQ